MTSKERIGRMFEHKESDRIPILSGGPWQTTVERWRKEGLPKDISVIEYFDLEKIDVIRVDNSPRYEARIIEETEEYRIEKTEWGVTRKNWKHATSTPAYIDFTIKDPETWKKAKERMVPGRDRIDWDSLNKNHKIWKEQGWWVFANLWFGFDITHAHTVGTERLLMALIEKPEWCMDMFNHCLDVDLALLDMVWEEGYRFDSIFWCDDMGYKNNQFFLVDMYRRLLKPVHKRAIEWAHNKGIKAHLHSCGNINPFVPELIEIRLDALNPLEVKAGMDPVYLKKKYGKDLVLEGGINAMNWSNLEVVLEEIKTKVPVLKESGGYIFSSDHSIPDDVSFSNYKEIINLVKELGSY